MRNPFTPNLMWHIEALLRGSGYDEETIEYAAHAINQHEKLVAERDELKRYVDKLPTYCAYCGFEVPIDDEAASKISEHIATCPKHPMRVIEAERDRLQAGAAVSECNRLRDLLQTCEAANKCLSMRVDVQATDLSQLKARNEKLVAVLDEYQFANQGLCPCCLGDNEDGHNDKCELAATLKGE